MTKTVCDFCGKDIKDPPNILFRPIAEYNFAILRHGSALDICNECKKSFEEWSKTRKEIVDEHQDQTRNQ